MADTPPANDPTPAGVHPGLRRERLLARLRAVMPRMLSLDVFDTLLLRPYPQPTDLFFHVHGELLERGYPLDVDAATFAHRRFEAEIAARRSHPEHEVPVEAIAGELSRALGGRIAPEVLVEAEHAVERTAAHLDRDVGALIVEAAALGIPYVLVSDMYLRGEQIAQMVDAAAQRAGIALPKPARIFVSGEVGTNKVGRMFDHVLSELALRPEQVLHVGDHPIADVESPKRRGVHVEHAFRDTPYLLDVLEHERAFLSPTAHREPYDAGLRTFRLRAATAAVESPDRALDHFHYGAFVLGPALVLFAEWVAATCRRLGHDRVYCLMREGHLLAPLVRQAAEADGWTLDARPLWTSRYALRGASVHAVTEAELAGYLSKRQRVSAPMMARDLGLDLAMLQARSGVAHDEPVTAEEERRLATAVLATPELRAQTVADSARKRERYFAYLEREGFFEHERAAIVDLGWGGTIQSRLEGVVRGEPRPRHIAGLYFATHDYVLRLPARRCSAESYAVHVGRPDAIWAAMHRSPEVLELACMPPLGSLRELDADGSPVCFPQLLPPTQLAQIAAMQRGIRHFADVWLPGASERRARLTLAQSEALTDRVRAVIARAIRDPLPAELPLFERWHHDENDGSARTEPMLGRPDVRERARHLTYAQILALPMQDSYWPAALARAVGREPPPAVGEQASRAGAGRRATRLVSRSAAAVARLFGRK